MNVSDTPEAFHDWAGLNVAIVQEYICKYNTMK